MRSVWSNADAIERRGGVVVARRTWRDRWPATPVEGHEETRLLVPERMERTYGSVAAYQRDAAVLAKDGWQVPAVDDRRERKRDSRCSVLSWFRRRRAGSIIVVAYRRLR
jgi:hypothetical protein